MTDRRKQYWAIRETLSSAEKDLIAYYELQWMLRHHVPTIEEVTQHLKKAHPTTNAMSVNYYLQRRGVIKGLDNRGIPWRQHSQSELTQTQVATAIVVMNFADDRTIPQKLEQLGILPATYYAWLNDPQFKNLVDNLSDQNLTNIRPAAIAEFTRKINGGDWNAIKFWLETTGELSNNDAPQSEQMLKFIIEIIQEEIKDPEVIVRIAQRIKAASQNRTLEITPPLELTGELVEDQELIEAKKKLGV